MWLHFYSCIVAGQICGRIYGSDVDQSAQCEQYTEHGIVMYHTTLIDSGKAPVHMAVLKTCQVTSVC